MATPLGPEIIEVAKLLAETIAILAKAELDGINVPAAKEDLAHALILVSARILERAR